MNVTGFRRDGVPHPGSFGSSLGQQFHPSFPSSNARLDRPDSRPFSDFADGVLPQDQIVLDSNSGKILVPHSRTDQEPDPISRFYNGETPWNPQGIENVNPWPPTFITHNKSSVVRPHAPYPGYREPVRSNPDSHVTGQQQPDSGYVTNGAGTKSVASGGEAMETGDDNQSFINGMETMQLQGHANGSYYSGSTQTAPSMSTAFGQWHEQDQDSAPALLSCTYPDCKDESRFKNASELKKHQQRHDKPHKCDFPGCTRKEGFTTKNDLDRHKKSLHGISLPNDRSFKCAGAHCNRRTKVWPRLDNFKSHCQRMHSKEDIDELIKKSEVEIEKAATVQPGPGHNLPGSMRTYASSDGCIQDANLLLDLSQGAQHTNGIYPSSARGPMINRITNQISVPAAHAPQERQESKERVRFNPVESTSVPRLAIVNENSSSIKAFQLQSANGEQKSSNPNMNASLGNPPNSEKPAEKPYATLSNLPAESSNLLVTRAEFEDCSRQLLSDISKELSLDSANVERVRKVIDRRIEQLCSTLQPAKKAHNDVANEEPSPRPKRVRCRICNKTMDRPCDLKKHEKRHSRPWGCTNATCNKTFGSKNDWKRHENSQHYQLETWRCHEAVATSKIGTCAKIFYRRDPFQVHLRRDHSVIDEEYIREQCRKRRIGRNWQNGFWCGFCKAIVKLSTRGLEAWDERFNHIDDMHFKQGQSIDDWYPMDKDLPKGKLKGLHHRHRRGESGDDGGLDGGYVRESTGDGDGDRDGRDEDEDSEQDVDRSSDSEVEDYPVGRTKRRRSYNDHGRDTQAKEDLEQREATPRVVAVSPDEWFCDHCDHGPMSVRTDFGCASCGRRRPA